MNYYERHRDYLTKNFFVFNEKNGTVDVFGPNIQYWNQKLTVVLDMLMKASEVGIQDKYDILRIRVVGVDPTSEHIRILRDNLSLANKLLADTKGESTMWIDIKEQSLEKRHFLDIVVDTILEPKQSVIKKVYARAKSKPVQNIPSDIKSV